MKQAAQWTLYALAAITFSCQSESIPVSNKQTLSIRLTHEPDRLNPMLSRQATASEVERNIFAPLTDYDPNTLELAPVLLKQRATVTPVTTGAFTGGLRYEMAIRDEATWDDGTPVTGYDYLFSMKAALNPFVANASWRTFISSIADIAVDEDNPKKILAWMAEPYILGEEVICGFNVYPEHIYDSAKVLRNFSFQDLKHINYESGSDSTAQLEEWANQFNSDRFSRQVISGCGPYRLVEWQPNRQIILERKSNHWSNSVAKTPTNLVALPDALHYYLIPEAQTAITSLKDGKLDIVSDLSAEQYAMLTEYNRANDQLEIKEAPVLQYYYIAYNNAHPILRDRNVRNALSHLIDMDEIIQKLFKGLGTRTIGPVHPSKSYYNRELTPIKYDPENAEALLNQSNWQKSNSGGLRAKQLNGQASDLTVEILTSRSRLSQDLGIILKENAAKLGIEIKIVPLEFRVLMQRVRAGDYDLACLASNQAPGLNDPYNNWHSDNAGSIGNNYCKFSNPACDEIIEVIRTTLDPMQLDPLYKQFQEIIYREQPALFLVAPTKVIAHSKRVSLITSVIRPGYFANLAKLE